MITRICGPLSNILQALLILFVGLAPAGCARSPEVQFYALDAQWHSSEGQENDISNILAEVSTPTLPSYVRRDEIVERLDDFRFKIHEHERWVTELDKLIRDFLVASLQAQSSRVSFVTGSSKMADQATYRLDTFFSRFDIYHQNRIEVSFNWQITDLRGTIVNGPNSITSVEHLEDGSVNTMVLTLNSMMHRFSVEMAGRLDALARQME